MLAFRSSSSGSPSDPAVTLPVQPASCSTADGLTLEAELVGADGALGRPRCCATRTRRRAAPCAPS